MNNLMNNLPKYNCCHDAPLAVCKIAVTEIGIKHGLNRNEVIAEARKLGHIGHKATWSALADQFYIKYTLPAIEQAKQDRIAWEQAVRAEYAQRPKKLRRRIVDVE